MFGLSRPRTSDSERLSVAWSLATDFPSLPFKNLQYDSDISPVVDLMRGAKISDVTVQVVDAPSDREGLFIEANDAVRRSTAFMSSELPLNRYGVRAHSFGAATGLYSRILKAVLVRFYTSNTL